MTKSPSPTQYMRLLCSQKNCLFSETLNSMRQLRYTKVMYLDDIINLRVDSTKLFSRTWVGWVQAVAIMYSGKSLNLSISEWLIFQLQTFSVRFRSGVRYVSSSTAYLGFICLNRECFPKGKWFSKPINYEWMICI